MPNILCLSETWLSSSVSDSEITLPNYSFLRHDRQSSKKCGGVLLYFSSDIRLSNAPTINNKDIILEYIICTLKPIKGHNINLCVAYRPPDTPSSHFNSLIDDVEARIPYSEKGFILTGDLNIDLLCPSTPESRKLNNWLKSTKLVQLVNIPTRIAKTKVLGHDEPKITKTLIDVIITNLQSRLHTITTIDVCFSDHKALCFWSKSRAIKQRRPRKGIPFRFLPPRFRKNLLSDLSLINIESTSNTIETKKSIEKFYNEMLSILDTYAPIKSKGYQNRSLCPWLTKDTKHYLSLRDSYFSTYKKTLLPQQKMIYTTTKKLAEKMCKIDKANYYSNLISRQTTYKKQWKHFNELCKGPTPSPSLDINPDELNMFFSTIGGSGPSDLTHMIETLQSEIKNHPGFKFDPISQCDILSCIPKIRSNTRIPGDGIPSNILRYIIRTIAPNLATIFNNCIDSGYYPEIWKTALIIPIYKRGDKFSPSSYRPISLLSPISLVFETLLHKMMTKFLESNDLLGATQSGFRRNHSTETVLLPLINQAFNNANNYQVTLLALIDLTQAFDTLDRALLLKRLCEIGFSELALRLMASYLSNRHQRTVVDTKLSSLAPVLSGVPQGSVLGPLLFILCLVILSLLILLMQQTNS